VVYTFDVFLHGEAVPIIVGTGRRFTVTVRVYIRSGPPSLIVTATSPELLPFGKSTVMDGVFCPEKMVAPAGTVQV
jgi:hypothetical protein